MTGPSPTFRLAYVPGVTPGKWAGIWRERVADVPLTLDQLSNQDAETRVRTHDADAALLRLPVDRTDLHAIPLYTETTVVILPKDHLLTATEDLSADDIADAVLLHPHDDVLDWASPPGQPATYRPTTTKEAVELVAAGVGLLVVPQSLARLHHRRDLTYRPISGVPESSVALTWLAEETSDLMEQLIGIVRGRTANSTRGRQPTPPAEKKRPAKTERTPKAERTSKAGRPATGQRRTPPGTRRGKPRHR